MRNGFFGPMKTRFHSLDVELFVFYEPFPCRTGVVFGTAFDQCMVCAMNGAFSKLRLDVFLMTFVPCKNHDSGSISIESMNDMAPVSFIFEPHIIHASGMECVNFEFIGCNREEACWFFNNEYRIIFPDYIEVDSFMLRSRRRSDFLGFDAT